MEMEVKNSRPVVAWIGRLDEHKNWRRFMDIAQSLVARYANKAEFWMIGGMHADQFVIDKFISRQLTNNLQTSFRWLPYVAYDHMPYLYSYIAASGGCCVSTSINESFGMTVLEAMSCGCPVACNNAGALSELLSDERGLLFSISDETNEIISAKIIEFLDEPEKLERTVRKAYQYVRQVYHDDIIQAQFINILTEQAKSHV
jgi:glycosyltransferase involved in cell wall biosynthesis